MIPDPSIRLECLRLAVQSNLDYAEDVVAVANLYLAFLSGLDAPTADEATEIEVVLP